MSHGAPSAGAVIDSEFELQLGDKLAAIEQLRLELDSEGIECPGVLVVGAQSAGKSSVLERLTGIAFPIAENTCTRVPTIVQLQTNSALSAPKALVSQNADFTNSTECCTMKEVQDSILNYTMANVDDSAPIKDKPIHIRYSRRTGPVMTLIDLPGITHVDATNEAFDIHQVTSAMVSKYIDNNNMIVLVVIPANDDFGNSEALRIAQTFDKDGNRTIGVISKCDLVPENSDVIQKIQMTRESDVKLALGFIAVRNKGSGEDSIDIEEVEDDLFSSHKLLKQLRSHERGYQALSRKIVDLQSNLVSLFIPKAKMLVKKKIEELRKDLIRLGNAPSSASERRSFLTKEVCDIDSAVCKLIQAERSKDSSQSISARTLELSQNFSKAVRSRVPDCLGEEFQDNLRGAMKESMGYSLPNFMNELIFRDQVARIFFANNIDENSELLIDNTTELMNNVFRTLIDQKRSLQQFPKLAQAMVEEFSHNMQLAQNRVRGLVCGIIEAEKVQVFTQNPSYMKTIRMTKLVAFNQQKENIELEAIQNIESHYGHAVREAESCSKPGCGIVSKGFIEKYAHRNSEDTDEQVIMDMQISIHCYADTLMRRLFDVIPMVVRSNLVFGI